MNLRGKIIEAVRLHMACARRHERAPLDCTVEQLVDVFTLRPAEYDPEEIGHYALVPQARFLKTGVELLSRVPERAGDSGELARRIYEYMPALRDVLAGSVLRRAANGTPLAGAVLAGGAVSAALMTRRIPDQANPDAPSDVDFFMFGVGADEAHAFVMRVRAALRAAYDDASMQTRVSTSCVTYVCGHGAARRSVQIITSVASSLEHVFSRFDFGPSMFAFDGARAWTLRGVGELAWTHRLLIAHTLHMRGAYWARVVKYARRGFVVVLPQLRPTATRYVAVSGRLLAAHTSNYDDAETNNRRILTMEDFDADVDRAANRKELLKIAASTALPAALLMGAGGGWCEVTVPGGADPHEVGVRGAFGAATPRSLGRGLALAVYACRRANGSVNAARLKLLCGDDTQCFRESLLCLAAAGDDGTALYRQLAEMPSVQTAAVALFAVPCYPYSINLVYNPFDMHSYPPSAVFYGGPSPDESWEYVDIDLGSPAAQGEVKDGRAKRVCLFNPGREFVGPHDSRI